MVRQEYQDGLVIERIEERILARANLSRLDLRYSERQRALAETEIDLNCENLDENIDKFY